MKNIPMEGSSGPGTVVGVNVALTGVLKDQNDIAVYGMVEGEVVSDKLVTIGQTAQVKGPVKGQIITVAGIVRGAIEAHEKLEILETGKVFGSIVAKDLVVHSGATISGKVTMASEEEAEEVKTEVKEKENEKESKEGDKEVETASESEVEAAPDDLLLPDDE